MYTVYSMPITRNSSVKSTNTQLTKVHQIMTFSNHSSIAIPIWAMFKILCRPFKNWLIHIFQFMDCHNSQFMQEYNPRTHHQPSLITYTLIFDPHISLITIINHHLSPSSTIISHHQPSLITYTLIMCGYIPPYLMADVSWWTPHPCAMLRWHSRRGPGRRSAPGPHRPGDLSAGSASKQDHVQKTKGISLYFLMYFTHQILNVFYPLKF
jgi:hypothetical protein